MDRTEFEMLDSVIGLMPKYDYFSVTSLVNSLDETHAANKFLNETFHHDSKISNFLVREGFAKRNEKQDRVPVVLGLDLPHTSGTILLSDEGRKLIDAGSYNNYMKETEERQKVTKEKEQLEYRKLKIDVILSKRLAIGTFLVSIIALIISFFSLLKK